MIVTLIKPSHTWRDVNQKPAGGNGVCKDNHDPMGKMEEAYNATHWIRSWGCRKCPGDRGQYRW